MQNIMRRKESRICWGAFMPARSSPRAKKPPTLNPHNLPTPSNSKNNWHFLKIPISPTNCSEFSDFVPIGTQLRNYPATFHPLNKVEGSLKERVNTIFPLFSIFNNNHEITIPTTKCVLVKIEKMLTSQFFLFTI